MSIIAAGTTTTTALSSTGNTDGTLQFQVNGTTASLTLNTLGAVGVGSSPSFGTSGQVLISGGSTAAPTWGTAGTATSATTATNLAGGSNGTIPYQSAAGTTQMLAVGTAGQVLQTNGAGAPSWVTPSAGALVFISSQTVTTAVAQVDFTSGISSTYDDYLILYENVKSSADNSELIIRFYKSGSFQTSGYNFSYMEINSGVVGNQNTGNNSATGIQICSGNTSATLTNQSGRVDLLNVNSTLANACNVIGQITGMGGSTTKNYVSVFGGSQNTTAALTGIRFRFGNNADFSSGTFRLYGVAKS